MNLKNTLYAKYIKERLNQDILENENGFITYSINGEECFIAEMYVDKKKQSAGFGTDLIKLLNEIALEKGCKFITGNIQLFDQGKEQTMISALKCGFYIYSSNNQFITIIREVK